MSAISSGFFTWVEKDRKVRLQGTNDQWQESSTTALRIKFLQLILTNTFVIPLKMPIRVYGLLQGNFIKFGKSVAEREWINQPDRDNLQHKIDRQIVLEFVKEVVKILLFPLQVVLLTLSAIWGLVFPYDGRKFYSDIEELFSRPKVPECHYFFSEYTAPCMQPDGHKFLKNFFKMESFIDFKFFTIGTKRDPDLKIKNQIIRRLYRYKAAYTSAQLNISRIEYDLDIIGIQVIKLHKEKNQKYKILVEELKKLKTLFKEALVCISRNNMPDEQEISSSVKKALSLLEGND